MAPLPFDRTADVKSQANATTAAAVACSPVWPSGSRPGPGGQVYDARAELDIAAVAALQASNAKLVVDGVRYSIVDATPHEFLPHVEVLLRRVRGG